MFPIYRFMLTIGQTTTRVYPIYGDGLQKEWTKENGEQFFRERLSGELTFIRDDYETLIHTNFGTVFTIEVQISQDAGANWSTYWTGEFTLADCTINEDDKKITVQPSPKDAYTEVLDGIEKEFDLIRLKPEMAKIMLNKRPLLQVYLSGESVIGCYMAGMWWEQECEALTVASDIEQFGFQLCDSIGKVSVEGNITPDATGEADISSATPNFGADLGNGYNVSARAYVGGVSPLGTVYYMVYEVWLVKIDDITTRWEYQFTQAQSTSDAQSLAGRTFELPAAGGDATGLAIVSFMIFDTYARLLTDSEDYNNLPTSPLPANDMAGMSGIYKRVIGYPDVADVVVTANKTSTPTEWGLYTPGQYYDAPSGLACYPMARKSWSMFSVWFVRPVAGIEGSGVTQYTIKDAYPLAAVISALLGQIASGITFAADDTHSVFFYGETPGFNSFLFITPKSNALGSGYDVPAMKGPITLRQVLDMLRDTFRCYWYIDGTALKIEHIRYFMNGLSYDSPGVGTDLTHLRSPKLGKEWSFSTSKYKYNKMQLPARYQFAWMDDVTLPFNGQPIDIVSPYVQKDQIEQVQVAQFTSDVDYMRCNPGGCSKDGFALICGDVYYDYFRVPYSIITIEWISYNLQNGPLSFASLQKYYLYDLPAKQYKIGSGQVSTAWGIKRTKTQEITFPSMTDPNPMQLIKTLLGNGTVEKMSVNLSSRKIQATLKYVAE